MITDTDNHKFNFHIFPFTYSFLNFVTLHYADYIQIIYVHLCSQ